MFLQNTLHETLTRSWLKLSHKNTKCIKSDQNLNLHPHKRGVITLTQWSKSCTLLHRVENQLPGKELSTRNSI